MPLSVDMVAALTSGTGYFITLVEVISLSGDEIRLALATRDYVFGGETYKAFPFEISKFQNKAGTEPDNATIKHILELAFTRMNLSTGRWAGATITAYVVDFLHPEWGYARKHRGRVGEVTTGGYGAETEFRGLVQLLTQEIGWKTSKLCRYQLGDELCGVNLADFTVLATVTGVSNRQVFETAFSAIELAGLTGKYYGGTSFETLIGQRVDPVIDFTWTNASPFPGVGYTDFSVFWKGKVKFPATGAWTFKVEHDDGAELWVDNLVTPIISNWGGVGAETGVFNAASTTTKYDIELRFRQFTFTCYARLKWSHATAQPVEIIVPASRLYSNSFTTQEAGYYEKGRAVWVTGANAGRKMEIANNDGGEIQLFMPMQDDIAVGDTINLIAGDPKTLFICHNRFHNAINFGGEDGIPRRDQIFHIPD